MARALAWLAGPGIVPWVIGVAAVVIGGLAGAWRLEAARRDAAELRAAAVEVQLATATAAMADRANVIAALDRQADATRALRDELEPTRRVIHAAPRTTACVASPVVRAGIDSMRAARAAATTLAGPGAVAGASGVPAPAAGAADRTGR